MQNNEHPLAMPEGEHYAGYRLLTKISSGSVSVKMLIAQEYMAFREKNISTRQPIVRANGPVVANPRAIVNVNSPEDCSPKPTISGKFWEL